MRWFRLMLVALVCGLSAFAAADPTPEYKITGISYRPSRFCGAGCRTLYATAEAIRTRDRRERPAPPIFWWRWAETVDSVRALQFVPAQSLGVGAIWQVWTSQAPSLVIQISACAPGAIVPGGDTCANLTIY